MNRRQLLCTFVLLIAIGAGLWSLRQGEEAVPPSVGELIRRAQALPTSSIRETLKPGPDDLFTFEHEGESVTINLTQVRRSHAGMSRVKNDDASEQSEARLPDPEFDFLKWPQRRVVGMETIKTRKCWVIDFTNIAPDSTGHPHYLVRLFVDRELGALMRTNAYNWQEKRVLTYEVTRGRKVNGVLTVAGATASHYQPGTRKVVAEVAYQAKP